MVNTPIAQRLPFQQTIRKKFKAASSADPHQFNLSQFWIKCFCSVVLTVSAKHILMRSEMQRIVVDGIVFDEIVGEQVN